jgi:ferric iron reductase protein FhuF
VARLGRAIAAAGGVSPRVLQGNVSSAVAGAVRMLGAASPSHARLAWTVGQRLLDREPLLDTGSYTGTVFRRSTCCLYYQVPGGGYCGDCVLLGRADVRG